MFGLEVGNSVLERDVGGGKFFLKDLEVVGANISAVGGEHPINE